MQYLVSGYTLLIVLRGIPWPDVKGRKEAATVGLADVTTEHTVERVFTFVLCDVRKKLLD